MDRRRLGAAFRALRVRQQRTQEEAARAAGLSRAKVSQLENDRHQKLTLPEVERAFAALGARLVVSAQWNGAALDRLLDETHARLAGLVARVLDAASWELRLEVSFSEFGERGSIDILAWQPAARVLLVVEVKSELASIDGLLRPLDVKVRLARRIAAERFEWHATSLVGRVVVLPEDSTQRRLVARHAVVLATALPARSREVRRWLRQPTGPLSGLCFLSAAQTVDATRNPSAVRRVRHRRAGSGQA
jgi:transcriptional regulator with XRE-family HTH domain